MQWVSAEPIGYPKYEVSEEGDVRNINRSKPVKVHRNQHGRLYVQLYDGGNTRKTFLVDRLVAELYLSEHHHRPPRNFAVVHKDYNLDNNHYSNLEWRSKPYADRYHNQADRIDSDLIFPIVSVDYNLSGEPLAFADIYKAASHYGLLISEILHCLESGEQSPTIEGLYFDES